jgi:endonuclease/exonuclease/phosphatase family metal-dependent hydrolase
LKITWQQFPLNLFFALVNAYGLSVVGFLLLRWLVGDEWGLVALFNSFAHLLFLPALILLPLILVSRRRLSIGLLIPAALAFILAYGAAFVPRTAQAAPHTLRILTYNLKSQEVDLEPALNIIRDSDADVVALQELSEAMALVLASDLADRYPYQALHTQPGDPIPGQGVLSRYPLLSDDYWRIYLAHQRVTLEIEGAPITFYNTHPVQPLHPNGFARRGEEIRDLLARLETETGPLVIAGDFNMSDQSDDYWRIAGHYQDTYRAAGWGLGFTFPADLPYFGGGNYAPAIFNLIPALVRLDYVFHNDAFSALNAQVGADSGGSDHLPLQVDLALRPA